MSEELKPGAYMAAFPADYNGRLCYDLMRVVRYAGEARGFQVYVCIHANNPSNSPHQHVRGYFPKLQNEPERFVREFNNKVDGGFDPRLLWQRWVLNEGWNQSEEREHEQKSRN